MSRDKTLKKQRMFTLLETDPFMTDDALARSLDISVQSVRLYRAEMGIPELRMRLRGLAQRAHKRLKTISGKEILGELVFLELNVKGVSVFLPNEGMLHSKPGIIRAQYIFEQANTLAMAIIDAEWAVTGVAKIRFKRPVMAESSIVASAEVTRRRGNKFFVTVISKQAGEEVFRGKFIIVSFEDFKKGDIE